MQRTLAQILGVIVAFLAIAGLMTSGHLFGFINADLTLDLLRLPLAAALLYAGFAARNVDTARGVLTFTGVLYLGMALLGLINSTLWGILPSGLTGFDVLFHLLAGITAIGVANASHAEHHSTANRL